MKLLFWMDGGVWIPYPARKLSHFPHPAVGFWSYPASRMTFAQFESRIPRNFVTNPESRRQKRPNPASRETPSGAPHMVLGRGRRAVEGARRHPLSPNTWLRLWRHKCHLWCQRNVCIITKTTWISKMSDLLRHTWRKNISDCSMYTCDWCLKYV